MAMTFSRVVLMMAWQGQTGDGNLVFRTAGSESLTHNLPDGDRLEQGDGLAAPRDVDRHHPKQEFCSGGEILDGEATALDGLRVSRDPVLGYKREATLGTFLGAPQRVVPSRALGPPQWTAAADIY